MDKKEIKIKGKKVVYRVSGEGSPVMLIHGFGEKSEVWNQQIEYLQEKYKIIIPELPGSDESELQEDMSMEGMAETLKEILDAENISRCVVIGHSMGGYILLAFTEKYFSYLEAFGLFHSTAFADSEDKKASRRKGIEFMNEHGAFSFLENTTPNLFSPLTKDKRPEIIDEQIQTLHDFSRYALISYYEAMINRPDRTHILRNSTIPILFIAGKNDNAVPLANVLKQCHLPSLSYIHILENSGHMGMLEETEKANRILKNFLDKTTFT